MRLGDRWSAFLLVCIGIASVPGTVFAQATLAGVVRDSSGAVLPGVTVEASSSVLIEKLRSTTTDGGGRYQIIDLRPGSYTVVFSLPGFTTAKSDGVTLVGTATTTLNGELRVGGVEETVTVSGEAPTVDVQNTTRQANLDQQLVSTVPSARNPFALGVLIPGVNQSFSTAGRDVGGAVVAEVAALTSNGSRTGDQRLMINGVALTTGIAGGWGGGAVPNAAGTAEFAVDVSGVDAQAATGGVRINFIPRDGGNQFSGLIFGSYANEHFADDNYTGTDVQKRGLTSPNKISANGDFNPGVGGPIARDRVWFFLSGRYLFADNYQAGVFFNANTNKPDQFRFVSTGKPAILHQDQQIYQGRITWQVTPRNKIGTTIDQERYCGCPNGLTTNTGGLVSPEAANDRRFPLQRFVTLDWTSPITNRLLIEASGIQRVERWGQMHLQTGKGDNIDALVPGITGITDNPSLATGGSLTYRAPDALHNNSWNWNIHYRAAMSYITGSHALKVGFNNAFLHHENTTYAYPATDYTLNFAGGIPSGIVYRIPRTIESDVYRDLGLFAQDRWGIGRWTLSGGVRIDQFANRFPAYSTAPTFLAPNLSVRGEAVDNLNWKDVTPKLAATYDLFGNGRTALKVTLNKYLEGLGTTGFGPAQVTDAPHPLNRLAGTSAPFPTRQWTDLNGNFQPDCNLQNYQTNGECGVLTNAGIFGTIAPGTTYDPELLTGWGKRVFNWEFTAGVQHELIPRVSLDVQYARRWYGNFRVIDDLSVAPRDYERFTFDAPHDPRLPNAGSTLTGFDLTSAAALRPTNYFVTSADTYGAVTDHFDGVNISMRTRLQSGLVVQGGMSTARNTTDDCDIVDDLPETLHGQPPFGDPNRAFFFPARPLERCHQNNGWRTGAQALASFTIPRIDLTVSGTFQNLPGSAGALIGQTGTALAANANICSGFVIPGLCTVGNTTLGCAFSTGPFRAYNIVPAGAVYLERLNQLDLRVSKMFRIATTRTNVNFDFYNVTNSNSVLTEVQTYGATWRTPQAILLPRMFKLSAQFDF